MAFFPFVIILVIALGHPILGHQANHLEKSFVTSPEEIYSESRNDLIHKFKSFRGLEDGVPETNSTEEKLSWLRSQVIGRNVVFQTPFGERLLTYADHTATSRSLRHIENFILEDVLPFYGNFSTFTDVVVCTCHKYCNLVI